MEKELIDAALFIGVVIVGITQAIKTLIPAINGAFTIGVAVLSGVLVAVVDQEIGVTDISIAQGIMIAIGSVGGVTALGKFGNKPNTKTVIGKDL